LPNNVILYVHVLYISEYNVTEIDLSSNTGEISMINGENEEYQKDT
jgi:hypothetical protein